jgi:phosphoglycolate phosphatase-like HAD superfamily hydrolase
MTDLATAIFFDLDGTLIDVNPDPIELEQLREKISDHLSKSGVPVKIKSIFDMYQRALVEYGFDHPLSKRIRFDLDNYEARWARSLSVIKSGAQRLGEFCERGYMLAIVTNNGMAYLRELFDARKLRPEWFRFTVTRDDSSLLKPFPMPLQRACQLAHQQSPGLSKVWFVGDSEQDEQAAKAFNQTNESKLSFARIGTLSQKAETVYQFACLEDFFKQLLT